ncbi:MAG: hypothetical protein WBL31_00770, partial [Ilumatobacteraceae bacterium]
MAFYERDPDLNGRVSLPCRARNTTTRPIITRCFDIARSQTGEIPPAPRAELDHAERPATIPERHPKMPCTHTNNQRIRTLRQISVVRTRQIELSLHHIAAAIDRHLATMPDSPLTSLRASIWSATTHALRPLRNPFAADASAPHHGPSRTLHNPDGQTPIRR